jgi:Cu/Ag efflux protein CusF
MKFKMALALAIATLVLSVSPPTSAAQGDETRGVVQRVDVPSGTVYFTDGRTVRLDPGARLFVGSRQVQLADVQPGWTLVIPAPVGAAGAAAGSPATGPAPSTAVTAGPVLVQPDGSGTRAPIDATGVIARVDSQTGTITLQDGRVLRLTGRTTIWQPAPMTSLTPGASVYVRNAEPLDYRP